MEDNIIQLAALLHDVGKFWQGTGERGSHSELSSRFINAYVPEQWQEAAGLISLHHDPSKHKSAEYKPLKTVVCADWLSLGERKELAEEEERGRRRETPLMSIFSEIDIGKGKPASKLYYPIKKLELDKGVIFPGLLEGREEDWLRGDYEMLGEDFVEEIDGIKEITDFDAYFSTLYYLLQKYTWCVPSAVCKDVSLFDHLKTTCAIASCLCNAEEKYLDTLNSKRMKGGAEGLSEEEEKVLNEDKKFLLIGGDVSGVQKFIYSITSKGAVKGLRGRSFYLELLSETIAKYILRELGLPITNLLFCGGGHYYLLAPRNVEQDLRRLRGEIAKILLEIHRGELYLVLDWLPLSAADFQKDKFGEAWRGIGRSIARNKKRKFAEISELHKEIFGPIDKGGTIKTCKICGSEVKEKEEEERVICNFCKSLEGLAKEIGDANYWIEIWKRDIKTSNKEKGSWKDALSKFGVEYEFAESMESDLKTRDAERISVYKLNDTSFLDIIPEYKDTKSSISFGFKFMAKNTPWVQKASKEIKEFSDLANASEGIKNWAVLRADVDNLGRIFSEGLGENRSISRVSNLSTMFSLFFTGWVEKICEEDEYNGKVYAIYSGGDDLFVVGAWDKMPELGKKIYDDFRVFTCRNPRITLSAGITIAPSEKYPLYQAADLAGKALDKSKYLKEENSTPEEKDGITFLDKPMKWDKFAGEVTGLRDDLKELLAAGVSRGFLQKLNAVYAEYNRQRSKHGKTSARYDDRYGRWRWLLAYVIKQTKVSRENKQLLKEVERLILKRDNLERDNIEYSPVAVRWVEFLTRKE
jgi:CRISPR-associated protein Csm1